MTRPQLDTKRLCACCGAKSLGPPLLSDRLSAMQHGLRITAVSPQFGSAPARVPIPEGRSEIPQSNKLEFVSSGDAKAAEREEVTFEPDDAKTESRKIELKCLALAFIVSLAPSLVHAQTKPFQIMVMDAGFNDVELKTSRPDLYKALNAPALLAPVVSDATNPGSNQNLLQSNLIAHETDKGNHFIKVIALVMAPRSGKDIPSIEIVPTVEPIQHLILEARTRGPTTVDQLLILMRDYFLTLNKITQRENVRIVVRSVSSTQALLQTLCQSARVIVNQWPKCSSALESVYRQGFAKFFASNPMTAFVQAAGNDFARLGPLKDINWQDYSASNVLVVAALAKNQSSLESYSNWHPSLVRVAAPGDTVDPSSSRTVTGTSYSGPRAAVYVRDAMMNDERLSGSEAINFVLDHDAQTTPSLVGKVFGGKVLAEDFPALTGDQRTPVHPKVSRLKRLKAWLTGKKGQ